MFKGGYARKKLPTKGNKQWKKDLQSQIEEDVNWSFKLTNEDIRRITGTNQIADYCEEQHLKYIGHIIRQSYESYM